MYEREGMEERPQQTRPGHSCFGDKRFIVYADDRSLHLHSYKMSDTSLAAGKRNDSSCRREKWQHLQKEEVAAAAEGGSDSSCRRGKWQQLQKAGAATATGERRGGISCGREE